MTFPLQAPRPRSKADRRQRNRSLDRRRPGQAEPSEHPSLAARKPAAPTLADRRRRFVSVFLWNRHLTLGLLTLAVSLLSPFQSSRILVMAAMFANWVPFGIYLHLQLRKTGQLPWFEPWVECASNVVVVALVPALFPYALIVGFGQLAMNLLMWDVTVACGGATLMVVGYPLALALQHQPIDTGLLLLFAAFVPGLGLVSSRVQELEARARGQYEDLIVGLDAVVWEGDPQTGRMTFVSPQARDLFGVRPETLLQPGDHWVHPDDRERVNGARETGINGSEGRFFVDFRVKGPDDRIIHVRDSVRIARDATGKAVRLRGVMVDVTRQHEAEQTIRHQAEYDALTGLPNRTLFNETLRNRIVEAKANSESLAVLLLDLNGFKEVNDTLGHAVGDQLLQAIAGRLSAYLPKQSTVARLGGDEFAVMLAPANPRGAATLAETVAACLQPPITIDTMTIQAGASTGIALYPADGDSPAALLRRADAAMYEAKQGGRSHVFATPDDDQANVRRLQLLGELRSSIATGDFRLYHQPKIDLKTGRVVGTEGLIRWHHRQYGLLSPIEFVELTELSGLIQPLTRWILEQGIRQARTWRNEGFELNVAMNLSVRNFFDQGLPAFIAALLTEHDVAGEQITLEITESEVMSDRALARSALSAFRSLGVKISIDDFGTGFSSLSQLQQLPIDEIKVDSSFVAGMLQNNQDAVIVRSIIELGHNLGLSVVAEGAETLEQLAALRKLGADRAQGYVISRPIPPDDFTSWLRSKVVVSQAESGGLGAREPARAR